MCGGRVTIARSGPRGQWSPIADDVAPRLGSIGFVKFTQQIAVSTCLRELRERRSRRPRTYADAKNQQRSRVACGLQHPRQPGGFEELDEYVASWVSAAEKRCTARHFRAAAGPISQLWKWGLIEAERRDAKTQSKALPRAGRGIEVRFSMVGATGFEPATPCTPCKCATRLRHAPTEASV